MCQAICIIKWNPSGGNLVVYRKVNVHNDRKRQYTMIASDSTGGASDSTGGTDEITTNAPLSLSTRFPGSSSLLWNASLRLATPADKKGPDKIIGSLQLTSLALRLAQHNHAPHVPLAAFRARGTPLPQCAILYRIRRHQDTRGLGNVDSSQGLTIES
jgi:hypothetical protein